METHLLLRAVKEINEKIFIDDVVNQTFQVVSQHIGNIVSSPHAFNLQLSKLENILVDKSKSVTLLSDEELNVLNLYNFSQFYLVSSPNRISEIKSSTTTAMGQNFSNYYNAFKTAKVKANQIIDLLKPLPNYTDSIPDNEGVMEIVFDGKASINQFVQFNKQSNEWFIIFGGYAGLMGINREDFVIISIEKHSPASVKIKATIEIILKLILLANAIIDIEKKLSPEKHAVECVKFMQVGTKETKEKLIKEATDELEKKLEVYVDEIVEKRFKEVVDVQELHEKKANLNTAIHKQRDFNNNGGTVNFYINSNNQEATQQVLDYNKSRQEVKMMKDSAMKQITDIPKSDLSPE